MAFETFGKDITASRQAKIAAFTKQLMTNGAGCKATRLVLWNDNAQKYYDLGGLGESALQFRLGVLYDLAFADGQKTAKKEQK